MATVFSAPLPMPRTESRLSRLWAHEKASYGLRVFIALAAAIAYGWGSGQIQAVPALFLGIIASAIAETDDNAWGRTKSVLLSQRTGVRVHLLSDHLTQQSKNHLIELNRG